MFTQAAPAAPPTPPPEVSASSFQELRRRVELLEDDLAELHKRYRRLLGSVTKSEALARAAEGAEPADGSAAGATPRPAGLAGALTPAARAQLRAMRGGR